jgi:hypothetical protein
MVNMNSTTKTSLGASALIAGLAILIMAIAAPLAEYFLKPFLSVPGNASETFHTLTANEASFRAGIGCYLITFVGDVLAAGALYVFLKPVNQSFSLLAALFRLIYTVIGLVALLNLANALRLAGNSYYLTLFEPNHLYAQVKLLLDTFRNYWSFAFIFFGIHLGMLGGLVFVSGYIPKTLGILLIISGLGWLIANLQFLLFPQVTINYILVDITGSFELLFMLWLLIKGSRIRSPHKEELPH